MSGERTGRGLTFPMQLGVSGFSESSGVAKVEQSIRIILGTQPGERVMRPDFGCRLRGLAFAPNTPATADLARYYVTDSLDRWEPRIELLAVDVTNEPGRGLLQLQIRYRLLTTQTTQDLTYPFSLERAR
jgi:phage baseplate assembly protein W